MKLVLILALSVTSQSGQSPKPDECPMHAHTQVSERGEKGMGFSQTTTTHHFFLSATGGSIQVEANNASDAANRDRIRMQTLQPLLVLSWRPKGLTIFFISWVPACLRVRNGPSGHTLLAAPA